MHLVVPTRSGLPPIEHSFCHYLVSDPAQDIVEAYLKIKPDVQRKTASVMGGKMLRKPEVRDYIGKLMTERQKRMEMDEDWVIGRLRDICDRCMQYEVAERDEEGNPILFKFDAGGATKSLELIGKHMRMFSDKVDASQMNLSMNINLGSDKPVIEGEYKRVGSG